MKIKFLVEVELERTEGKFVSKDDAAHALREELEAANPGALSIDESEYDVADWTISNYSEPARVRVATGVEI